MPLMIIDVDTGVDDAVALAFAVSKSSDLLGVTTVAGNVPVEVATRNTLDVLSFLGREDIPVHRGASRPLTTTYKDAMSVHGGNGLGGFSLPKSGVSEQGLPGPAFILQSAEAHAGDLVLVMLGPLTNLAIALNVRPSISRQIRKVVVMGGAYHVPGNVTPQSEFNVYVDPDAANQVFAAPWDELILVGLDVTHQTVLSSDQWLQIPVGVGGAPALVRGIMERTFTERSMSGFYLHDPLAVAVALDPTLVSGSRQRVTVGIEGDERGKMVAVNAGETDPLVATAVDSVRFVNDLAAALSLPLVDASVGLDQAE